MFISLLFCLLICLPVYLPACSPVYLLTSQITLSAYLPPCSPVYLFVCLLPRDILNGKIRTQIRENKYYNTPLLALSFVNFILIYNTENTERVDVTSWNYINSVEYAEELLCNSSKSL